MPSYLYRPGFGTSPLPINRAHYYSLVASRLGLLRIENGKASVAVPELASDDCILLLRTRNSAQISEVVPGVGFDVTCEDKETIKWFIVKVSSIQE